MVGVEVREEDDLHSEPGLKTHHLALSTLAAVEQHQVPFPLHRDTGHVPANGRTRCGGA
jgi:hypothetical protein